MRRHPPADLDAAIAGTAIAGAVVPAGGYGTQHHGMHEPTEL